MERSASEAVAACIAAVMKNEPWQNCGFEKRPQQNIWAQGVRPKWQVELEQKLLEQMLSAVTAAYVVSRKVPESFVDTAVKAYSANSDIAPVLGFSSELTIRLKQTIGEYVSAPPENWPQLLSSRVKAVELPDKKMTARLSLGCTQFGTTAKNMVNLLRTS